MFHNQLGLYKAHVSVFHSQAFKACTQYLHVSVFIFSIPQLSWMFYEYRAIMQAIKYDIINSLYMQIFILFLVP